MPATMEPPEAVIISGPRRGEIIRLPFEWPADESAGEIQALNEALDRLDLCLQRFSFELRETTRALRLENKEA